MEGGVLQSLLVRRVLLCKCMYCSLFCGLTYFGVSQVNLEGYSTIIIFGVESMVSAHHAVSREKVFTIMCIQ